MRGTIQNRRRRKKTGSVLCGWLCLRWNNAQILRTMLILFWSSPKNFFVQNVWKKKSRGREKRKKKEEERGTGRRRNRKERKRGWKREEKKTNDALRAFVLLNGRPKGASVPSFVFIGTQHSLGWQPVHLVEWQPMSRYGHGSSNSYSALLATHASRQLWEDHRWLDQDEHKQAPTHDVRSVYCVWSDNLILQQNGEEEIEEKMSEDREEKERDSGYERQ